MIQKAFRKQMFTFVNFPNGLVWHKTGIYLSRQLSNPFISLIESSLTYQTVWSGSHLELLKIGEIKQIETDSAWLQVIHEKNIYNEVQEVLQPGLRLSDVPQFDLLRNMRHTKGTRRRIPKT